MLFLVFDGGPHGSEAPRAWRVKARQRPVKDFQNVGRWEPPPRASGPRRMNKRLLFGVLALGAALLAPLAAGAAEIWRWTDRDGHTHYTQAADIPPERRAQAVPADAPLPPGTPACEVAWHRYAASQACFDSYRLVGGGLKPEAFRACRELPEPEPCR
jgi:hypothetical protein